nr:MAG TPA: venom peptide [Caudoviricetes sp.]
MLLLVMTPPKISQARKSDCCKGNLQCNSGWVDMSLWQKWQTQGT